MTGPATGTVPVGPMLSMFDPIYVGISELGRPVYIRIIYKNILVAGEPGGGKSGLLNGLTAPRPYCHRLLRSHMRNAGMADLVLFARNMARTNSW